MSEIANEKLQTELYTYMTEQQEAAEARPTFESVYDTGIATMVSEADLADLEAYEGEFAPVETIPRREYRMKFLQGPMETPNSQAQMLGWLDYVDKLREGKMLRELHFDDTAATVPKYDIDIWYESKTKQERALCTDALKIHEAMTKKYGPDAKLIWHQACGKSGERYKNSWHIFVRKVGFYKSCRDMNPTLGLDLEGIDTAPYSAGPAIRTDQKTSEKTVKNVSGTLRSFGSCKSGDASRTLDLAKLDEEGVPTGETVNAAEYMLGQAKLAMMGVCTNDEAWEAIHENFGQYIGNEKLLVPDVGSATDVDIKKRNDEYSKQYRADNISDAELAQHIENIAPRFAKEYCFARNGVFGLASTKTDTRKELAHKFLQRDMDKYTRKNKDRLDEWWDYADGQISLAVILSYSKQSNYDKFREIRRVNKHVEAVEIPAERFTTFATYQLLDGPAVFATFASWASQNIVYINSTVPHYLCRKLARDKFSNNIVWERVETKNMPAKCVTDVTVVWPRDTVVNEELKIAPNATVMHKPDGARSFRVTYPDLWSIVEKMTADPKRPIRHYDSATWIPYTLVKPDLDRLQPDGSGAIFNKFGGFEMMRYKPEKKIDVMQTLTMAHLRNCTTNPDVEGPELVWKMFKRFACKVQMPQHQQQIFMMWYSNLKGTGKEFVIALLTAMFGHRHTKTFTKAALYFDDNFTDDLEEMLFVHLQELGEGGEAWKHIEQLKADCTTDTQWINPKHHAKYKTERYWDFVATTNNMGAIKAEIGDRRIEYYAVSEKWGVQTRDDPKNNAYWAPLWAELKDPDHIHAWFHFFLNMDTTGFAVRKPIDTVAWRNLCMVRRENWVSFLLRKAQSVYEDDKSCFYMKEEDVSAEFMLMYPRTGLSHDTLMLKLKLAKPAGFEPKPHDVKIAGKKAKRPTCFRFDYAAIEAVIKAETGEVVKIERVEHAVPDDEEPLPGPVPAKRKFTKAEILAFLNQFDPDDLAVQDIGLRLGML